MQYRDKLEALEAKYDDLTSQMADNAVINDPSEYRKVSKARSEAEEVVLKFREWKKVEADMSQAKGMLNESDPDLRTMAEEELAGLQPELSRLEEELKLLLLPRDPNDEKNVVLEI